MKILVACEESQAVTIEFRKLGYEGKEDTILQITYKFTNGCQQALGGNK